MFEYALKEDEKSGSGNSAGRNFEGPDLSDPAVRTALNKSRVDSERSATAVPAFENLFAAKENGDEKATDNNAPVGQKKQPTRQQKRPSKRRSPKW
jgi:hypothetical protein